MSSRFPGGDSVLVVGAQANSLGSEIADALDEDGAQVITAGLSGVENYEVDIRKPGQCRWIVNAANANSVVCTVGINEPLHIDDVTDRFYEHSDDGKSFPEIMASHFETNVTGPLNLLRAWLEVAPDSGQFVVISSNSAHIARTGSLAYCSSKAALSMAIRCAARDVATARPESALAIYGWEFGLLEGTPMTRATRDRLPEGTPLTRMRGLPNGIPLDLAAHHVVSALSRGWRELNGCMMRIDAGEQ